MIAPYFLENFWVGSAFNLCFLHRYYSLVIPSRCSVPIIFVSRKIHCYLLCGDILGYFVAVAVTVVHTLNAHRPSLIFHSYYYFAILGFWASVTKSNMRFFRNPPSLLLIGYLRLVRNV